MKNIIYLAIIVALGLTSCDIIESNYEETSGPVEVDTAAKKVLLEEYTGFLCGHCPKAAREAHRLKEVYGDGLILMSIHAGSLALPNATHKENYLSKAGNAIEKRWNVAWGVGTPNGMINRTVYGASNIIAPDNWETSIKSELNKKADMKIDLAPVWSATFDKFDLEVKVKYLAKGDSTQKLAVFLLEDSVVGYQLDYYATPNDVENYVHESILRDAVTNVWGETIAEGASIPVGAEITKNFSYTIPAGKTWRPAKLRLVAVVMNANNDYEILQAEEIYVSK